MEFKCAFCGKPYSDPNRYVECVMRCNELKTAREDEEKRKAAADESKKKMDRIKEITTELIALISEVHKTNPSLTEDSIFKALGINLESLSEFLPPIRVFGKRVPGGFHVSF